MALAAQGFARTAAAPASRAAGTCAGCSSGVGLLQIDSVNVLARAHYLPLVQPARPVRPRRCSTGRATARPRRLFEYWGHEASLLPVDAAAAAALADGRAPATTPGAACARIAAEQPGAASTRCSSEVRDARAARRRASSSIERPRRSRPVVGLVGRQARARVAVLARAGDRRRAGAASSASTTCPSGCCRAAVLARADAADGRGASASCVRDRRARARGRDRAPTCATTSACPAAEARRARSPSSSRPASCCRSRVEGWRAAGATCTPGARLPRRVRGARRCSRRSTRWSGSARAPSGCSASSYRIEIYVPAPKRVLRLLRAAVPARRPARRPRRPQGRPRGGRACVARRAPRARSPSEHERGPRGRAAPDRCLVGTRLRSQDLSHAVSSLQKVKRLVARRARQQRIHRMQLLLVPLDDSIVFPGMTVTLAVDVGDEERVFLLPRHDGEFGRVGVVAEVVERGQLPGGDPRRDRRRPAPRASPAPPQPTPSGEPARRGRRSIHDGHPDDEHTRELEREYRAVVEEILELRGDDGRIARLPALDRPSPARWPTPPATRPDLTLRAEGRAARDARRDRAARAGASSCSASGSPSCRSAARIRDDVESGAQKQQREYFLRKQMESIRKELGEDDGSVVDEYRSEDRRGRRCPRRSREQAERELRPPRAAWASSRGESSMIRTYLDWLIAVPWCEALRGAARPRRTPARCSTPTTPASRTSRSASPSTSRCASCARSAAIEDESRAAARS